MLVTAASARDLLAARHGDATGCRVVTQGFDADIPSASPSGCDGPLRVLYTGSFYSFRRADALVRAVLATAGVVLDIASINVPAPIVALARQNPERIRLRGFLRHDVALANQRTAHVLINLANHDPAQVPGKFYEYLGSGRPLLHVSDAQDDAPARLLRGLQRGWTCGQSETEIKAVLQTLGERHRAGTLEQGLRLDPADVQAHAWQALAGDVERALEEAIAEARGRSPRR